MRSIQLLIFFFLFLFSPSLTNAGEKISSVDTAIATSLKMLANGYVFQGDLDEAKQMKIAHLNAMSDAEFQSHYRQIYSYLSLTAKEYGFTPTIQKDELLKKIKALDKKTLYEIIDSVPNDVVAKRFWKELRMLMDQIPDGSIPDKIEFVWQGVVQRIKLFQGDDF